jgi:hypothetical protein
MNECFLPYSRYLYICIVYEGAIILRLRIIIVSQKGGPKCSYAEDRQRRESEAAARII